MWLVVACAGFSAFLLMRGVPGWGVVFLVMNGYCSGVVAAIDYDNMARMVEYQLGRADVLLAGSGWELKGFNPNQPRGKSSAASNSGSFISHGGWRSDFPTIEPMTSGPALTSHPGHEAAKNGDDQAAAQLVTDLINTERIAELGRLYPKAILIPVHAKETVGQNKIPRRYVEHISELTGQETSFQIVQTNKVGHTKAPAWWRFIKRAEFTGPVEAGRDYIIADDYVTLGGTVSDLRRYIEGKGGRVVAATALAVASSERNGSSADLALTRESLIALETKFTNNGLKELLKEYGIYEGNPKSLTENEAHWLLTFSSLENVRKRIDKGQREGWTAETQKPRKPKSKNARRSGTERKAFYLETSEEAEALPYLATKLLYDPFIHEQADDTETFQEQRTQAHSIQARMAGGDERSRQVDTRRDRATQSGCGRGCQACKATGSRANSEAEEISGATNEPLHRSERFYTAWDSAKAKARSDGMGHDIDGQSDCDFRKALSGEAAPRYARAHSSMLGGQQETVPAHGRLLNGVTDTLIHYGGSIKTFTATPHALDSSTIAAIDYDNMARMVEYQLGRADVLLAGSGWELKGFNPNQPRGKSSSASNSGSFASHRGWPSDFPSIQPMTNGEKLKNHPDYRSGKKGDFKAATRVVEDIANREKVAELGALYPKAKIVPVHAIESAGVNQLPARFADFIAEQNKMDVVWDIVQTNKVHHTDADAASRFINRAQFDGPVEQGRDYIIADDFVTTGGTVSELRQYIEHNGGRVVAVTSLAVAGGKYTGSSNNIALKERTLVALKKKFGKDNLHDFLRENNAYNGNITALTENEGRWLLRFSRLDNARARIAENRSETKFDGRTGVYACTQSRARRASEEETGVITMAIPPLTDTLIHYGGSIKTLEENGDCWRFGGWLVVFGSHDASRFKDKFTAQTDFDIEDGERRGLYYNHGLDGTIKRTKLGDCRVYVKAAGVWIEGQIRKRSDYLKSHAEKIAANIESFGLSSGAPAHLVERKAVPGGHEILLWPLAEASITPTPAEPLTGCFSLKALVGAGHEVLGAGGFAPGCYHASGLSNAFDFHSSGPRDGLAFDDHCAQVLAAVGELQERVDGLAQIRCVKSKRRWSAGKFETLNGLADGLGLAAQRIESLAQEHAPCGDEGEVLQALARFEAVKARVNGVNG